MSKYTTGEMAKHTPAVRKLTCSCCGHHGVCVEAAGKEDYVKD